VKQAIFHVNQARNNSWN